MLHRIFRIEEQNPFTNLRQGLPNMRLSVLSDSIYTREESLSKSDSKDK